MLKTSSKSKEISDCYWADLDRNHGKLVTVLDIQPDVFVYFKANRWGLQVSEDSKQLLGGASFNRFRLPVVTDHGLVDGEVQIAQ